jgi:hypothetical protein
MSQPVTCDGAGAVEILLTLDSLNVTIRKVEKLMEAMPPFSTKRRIWNNNVANLYDLRLLIQKELKG